jgi:iron complex outermembrane receptor protein
VTFSKTTFRGSLDHNFTSDIMGYISFNRGFKSGFYNTISYSSPPVQPEVLNASEVGIKSEFFDHMVRVNAAGYFYKYSDLQVPESINGSTFYVNAASATIKGGDMDLTVAPTKNLLVNGGLSYTNGVYTSFPEAPFYTPNPAGGNILTAFNAAGDPIVHAPSWTGNMTGTYKIPTPVGTVAPSLSFVYNDGFCWNVDCHVRQPSYNLVNSNLAWTSVDESWGMSLWVKNMFSQQYYRWANEQVPSYEYIGAPPRTYGITVHAKF